MSTHDLDYELDFARSYPFELRNDLNGFDSRANALTIYGSGAYATQDLVDELIDDGTPTQNAVRLGHELLDILVEQQAQS